jgi:hypothetical protein
MVLGHGSRQSQCRTRERRIFIQTYKLCCGKPATIVRCIEAIQRLLVAFRDVDEAIPIPYTTLPPKKLGGMDNAFLDKRRKGLARFVNFLVCHPVLGQDQVVEKFLSEPSELLAWRRQHPPSIDEEFVRLDPDVKEIQAGIPADLEDRLAKVGSNMATSIEHYKNMCFAVERMIKRTEAQANDYSRYSSALR